MSAKCTSGRTARSGPRASTVRRTLRPSRPRELEDGRELGGNGTLYVGTQGVLLKRTYREGWVAG